MEKLPQSRSMARMWGNNPLGASTAYVSRLNSRVTATASSVRMQGDSIGAGDSSGAAAVVQYCHESTTSKTHH
jgi:hypothetical protein